MTREEFNSLNRGDIISHKIMKDHSWMVEANYGNRVTAVDTIDVTNPDEWDITLKAFYKIPS